MSETLTLVANATVAKLMNASRETMLAVSEMLSYSVEGAEFMHSFANGSWNGRSTFFKMTDGTFPAGFFHSVHAKLLQQGHRVLTKRSPLPDPLGPESPIVDTFGNDDPRYDYQMRALKMVEKHGRGIIQVATGGGKSKICKLIVARYRRMTMFITTRGVLMYQMKKGFEEADFRVGVIGDGVWSPNRGINVGMVQTLVSQLQETDTSKEVQKILDRLVKAEEKEVEALKVELKAKKTPLAKVHDAIDKLVEEQEKRRPSAEALHKEGSEKAEAATRQRARLLKVLSMVEIVIGEEAHEAGGNSYYEILRHCKQAQIRIALTATPFMRQDAESNMRLMAAFGGVLIRVSEQLLIERGVLALPYFHYPVAPKHSKVFKTTPWQRAYKFGIVENDGRNEMIVANAARAARYRLPVMILVTHKAHGRILEDLLGKKGLTARFILGESDQATRQKALNDLGSGKINVLIGTTILDVGVDVPACGMVILAGGGKAEIALRQRIGRGLRAKKVGPNVAFILDFHDDSNAHLYGHSQTRRAIVEDTPGFAENIQPVERGLPWHLFEEERKAA